MQAAYQNCCEIHQMKPIQMKQRCLSNKIYSQFTHNGQKLTGTVLGQRLLERTDAAVSATSRVVLVRARCGRVVVVLVEPLHRVLGHIPVHTL